MAASLGVTSTVTDSRGDVTAGATATVSASGNGRDLRTPNIGTAEETHTLAADVSGAAGWCLIENHGPTNYVEIGMATTVYVIKLLAGEVASLRLPVATTALYLKANTAAVDVTVAIWAN